MPSTDASGTSTDTDDANGNLLADYDPTGDEHDPSILAMGGILIILIR